jgi:hypothetical protein
VTERKCSLCKEPGHTRRTCVIGAPADQRPQVPAPEPVQLRQRDAQALDRLRGQIQEFKQRLAAERHVHRFEYGDDDNGHSGSYCECGMEEPDAPAREEMALLRPEGIYSGSKPGPWFDARFPGICERGGEGFEEGEEIRADGEGGYECRDCVGNDVADAVKPVVTEMMRDGASLPPTVDPARAHELFAAPADVPATVTEGPRTDRNGHRLKDPVLGDYRRYKNGNIKSIRRVTTFNDAVDAKDNLTGWMKRNVLIGASAHPEIVAQAHGLTHEEHKDRLNQLVKRLEEAAGSNKAADLGTLVHKLTERVDAGEPLSVVPAQFLPLVVLYRQTLANAGLRVVPGLIENTTFIPEWGGVAGSFDRVYEHIATGVRYIGDVKTGKTMDWGWQKIECQLAVYAQGYNRFGTYDWERAQWSPPERGVSASHGIVVHLPVSGELVGTCFLLDADLTEGWAYAAVCGAVWEQRSVKSKASPWKPAGAAQPVRQWDVEFSSVTSRQQAAYLWGEARSLGVPLPELDRLVRLAQATLSMS